jgi:hypothetical protein
MSESVLLAAERFLTSGIQDIQALDAKTFERASKPMRRPRLFFALAFGIVLTGALSACAVYKKCGLSGCPGDADITAEVQGLFDKHPELEPPNLLHVQTLDHVVYLTGVVDTDLERQMAESVAHEAPGVTKVINSIGLSGGR